MRLSELVFECVKDSITLPNPSISCTQLINDMVEASPIGKDWELQASGVFSALNLGLSRLRDENKIPYSIKEVELEDGVGNLSDGDIVNVVRFLSDGSYESLRFNTLGLGGDFRIVTPFSETIKKVTVEYKKTLPHLSTYSLVEIKEGEEDANIDLKGEYGITNNMCDYLKEFVKGQLMEYVSSELANLHNNRAEQYFNAIRNASSSLSQSNIINVQQGWYL